MNDIQLAMPTETTWLAHQDECLGAIDVIGEYNGKYLVNVRGSIPVELEQYAVVPVTPIRVWA